MTQPLPPAPPPNLPEQMAFSRQSRYQRPRYLVSWWGLLIGVVLGIGGGLFYAWNIAPLEETETTPRQLRYSDKQLYAVAIALNFGFESDLNVAITHLLDLVPDAPDPIQALAEMTCDLARTGYVDSSSGLRAVRAMKTFYQLQGRSGCADSLIPDVQAVPLEVTIVVPTNTPTLPPPPSKTPTPLVVATLTPEGVVIVPTTQPRRAYEGRIVSTFCDSELSGIIEVFIQDFGNEGIPGEVIRVKWDGGESTFVSGLKPERGPAYADFVMERRRGYTIEMPGLSDPIASVIVADTCFTPEGLEAVTSYRVVFNPSE